MELETMENTEVNVENTEVTPEEELSGGGLPSSVEEELSALDKFKIDDDIQSKYFKNGKINGKYGTIQDLIEGAKSYEDKYSQLMREVKSGKYQEVANDTNTVTNDTQVDVLEVAQPLIDKYVSNGMELTDEILEEAKAKGLDIRDVKLAAIELKEQIQAAYNVVGGKDEYNAMLDWAKANLPDKAKAEFDKGLKSGMGEYAIKGLYAEYKSANGSAEQSQRIRGDGATTSGIRPYSTLQEVLKDKAYIDSIQGRHDSAAKALFERRKAMTPDHVFGI